MWCTYSVHVAHLPDNRVAMRGDHLVLELFDQRPIGWVRQVTEARQFELIVVLAADHFFVDDDVCEPSKERGLRPWHSK